MLFQRPGPVRNQFLRIAGMAGVALTFLQGIVVSAKAHPLHQASAEAHYNPTAKTLEVSMALYVNDLETALTQRAGLPVNLDTTPAKELDGMLTALLKETFLLTNPEGSPFTLTWVGRQLEMPAAPSLSTSPAPPPAADTTPASAGPVPSEPRLLLFFQFQLTGDPEAYRIKFSTLTHQFPDQKNLIQIHSGPRRAALAFSPSSLAKPITFTNTPGSPNAVPPMQSRPPVSKP